MASITARLTISVYISIALFRQFIASVDQKKKVHIGKIFSHNSRMVMSSHYLVDLLF